MNNLYDQLIELLKQDERLWAEDQLLKNQVIEFGLKLDPALLKLLLSHDRLKAHFFVDVDGVMVFDKEKFIRFVNNKAFLPDSYTSFKNKIGLTVNGHYLSESRDVVLAWPYKDCVLEGGQTKEDQKRAEIFWNEILAPDEIDRLLEPKVFTGFKRFNTEGEHEVTEIHDTDNLIIKGNNLLALHSLRKRFAGKVKLIYIDPPYNTGNDSFQYNDRFNHSTWLTFIKNRLEIAHYLLLPQGTIAISIDHNEISCLLILLDEIFGKQNRKNIITVKRGSVTGAKVINPGVVNISEYVVLYSKDSSHWNPNRVYRQKERDTRYNKFIVNVEDNPENWEFITLSEAFSASYSIPKNRIKRELGNDYEIELEQFIIANQDSVFRFAALDDRSISAAAVEVKYQSRDDDSKVYIHERDDKKPYYIFKGQLMLFAKDRLTEIDGVTGFGELITDIWNDVLPNDLHNEGGIELRKGKKPEKLISRIIELCTNENELVLDFFIGSGTTAAVSLKLNRRFIGIEQLDYVEELPVVRLLNTIEGENSGISRAVSWQGGGSFIYCELMPWNERFIQQIQAAQDAPALQTIWTEMQEKGFLSYRLDITKFDEHASDFADLSLDDQKCFLLEVLDKNQLYVNLSEIDDETYGVSAANKRLNKLFYFG